VTRVRTSALLLVTLLGCSPVEGPESDPPAAADELGRLVIIGGALRSTNGPVFQAVLDGRAGSGPLCVVPTASGDPEASMEGMVETLTEYGGEGSAKGVLISTATPERARDPQVAAELGACSGFYFTGGSQSRILDVFLPAGDTTAAYRAIEQRWREGAVVAGSSAGAAMMSRIMIAGGGSDEAIQSGVAAEPEADGVQLRPGMGFFDPILDQHFLARGRIGRLLVAVGLTSTPSLGFGIDENTALVVDADSARVVGVSGVVVVDGNDATVQGPARASGLRVSLAGSGDVIDLGDRSIRPGAGKQALPVADIPFVAPDDPFERWAFLGLVRGLASTAVAEVEFGLGDVTLRVTEAPDFSTWFEALAGGVQGTPAGLSAGPFLIDLVGPAID
jgi:cyanophycinase